MHVCFEPLSGAAVWIGEQCRRITADLLQPEQEPRVPAELGVDELHAVQAAGLKRLGQG